MPRTLPQPAPAVPSAYAAPPLPPTDLRRHIDLECRKHSIVELRPGTPEKFTQLLLIPRTISRHDVIQTDPHYLLLPQGVARSRPGGRLPHLSAGAHRDTGARPPRRETVNNDVNFPPLRGRDKKRTP